MDINNYLTEQSEILQELLENFNSVSLNESSDKSDIVIATNMFLTEAGETAETIRLLASEKIAAVQKSKLTTAEKNRKIKAIENARDKKISNLTSTAKKVRKVTKTKIVKSKPVVKNTGKTKKVVKGAGKKTKGGKQAAKEFFKYVKKMKPGTKVAAVGIPLAAAGLYAANKYKKSNSPSPSNEEEHFDFSNLLNYDE